MTVRELRAKAAHYRQLARMLDEDVARNCLELADRYDKDAAAIEITASQAVPLSPK